MGLLFAPIYSVYSSIYDDKEREKERERERETVSNNKTVSGRRFIKLRNLKLLNGHFVVNFQTAKVKKNYSLNYILRF